MRLCEISDLADLRSFLDLLWNSVGETCEMTVILLILDRSQDDLANSFFFIHHKWMEIKQIYHNVLILLQFK